ncbi:MAG: hypothetical protein IPK22_13645 [Verrucomicrobiaceae bacterium]|nr:hypothetical protein [Verrucomicrobiaceae bacterium]
MSQQTHDRFPKVYSRNNAACDKLIITVHGMGDQRRNDMAASVAGLMARTYIRRKDSRQAVRLPSGLWEGHTPANPVYDDAISFTPMEDDISDLAHMAFAEIHWADILRDTEKSGFRIEGSPPWAGSVVDRLRQRHDLASDFAEGSLSLGASVVEEVAETVKLLGNLLYLTDKAGIFTFDLGKITEQYLGDVQQVADFMYVRRRCLVRFKQRMRHLAKLFPAAKLHFVAHSEGSVMTLFTLLDALRLSPTGKPRQGWVERVESLTTFGSPIDKHLILWPEMWGASANGEEAFVERILDEKVAHETCARKHEGCAACQSACDQCDKLTAERRKQHAEMKKKWVQFEAAKKIRWRNYYDLADPVGYDLDTARQKLLLWGCDAFDFKQNANVRHDHGFRRYPMAGKAHVDYFDDVELFRHIRDSAILGNSATTPPGATKWGRTSPLWPWVIVAAMHVAAVLVLNKGMTADAVELIQRTDFDGHAIANWLRSWPGIIACSLTLLGTTTLSRLNAVLNTSVSMSGLLFWAASLMIAFQFRGSASAGTACLLLFVPSLLVLFAGDVARHWSQNSGKSPVWALRWQMMAGGGALGVVVLWLFRDKNMSLTTAIGSGAGFLFLWWIASLLFDLIYVWQRYINRSREATFLHLLRQKMKWHAAAEFLAKKLEDEKA